MKKGIIILISIVVLCFVGFKVFFNGFSNIESITLQKPDEPFETGEKITDKKKIGTITGILNRANHSKSRYKMAIDPEYKMQIVYKNNSKEIEILQVYPGFGKDKTLLSSDTGDSYIISSKQTKKLLEAFK
ncbi:hypothetical protein [Cytobacillus solani]|uniref:YhfM-like domain-containing protein n=1 Tax=Cytobacillus solani TaxID=1637975 RepID=A0A0Q3VG46_9BACI|nr:hypothetical protein [Cytobacillus solani]KQL18391.1 hypothetical protein AN957_07275 [Cytobacillus solani]